MLIICRLELGGELFDLRLVGFVSDESLLVKGKRSNSLSDGTGKSLDFCDERVGSIL